MHCAYFISFRFYIWLLALFHCLFAMSLSRLMGSICWPCRLVMHTLMGCHFWMYIPLRRSCKRAWYTSPSRVTNHHWTQLGSRSWWVRYTLLRSYISIILSVYFSLLDYISKRYGSAVDRKVLVAKLNQKCRDLGVTRIKVSITD